MVFISNVKLYVPVATSSINNNINFLENIKQVFKRTVSWNKYRSKIAKQPKNNNLDYTIDPTLGQQKYVCICCHKGKGLKGFLSFGLASTIIV